MEVLYPWLEEARAWVAVASGDLPTAAEVLRLLAARTAQRRVRRARDVRAVPPGPAGLRRRGLRPARRAVAHRRGSHRARRWPGTLRAVAGEDGGSLLAVAEELRRPGAQPVRRRGRRRRGHRLLPGHPLAADARAAQRLAELRVLCRPRSRPRWSCRSRCSPAGSGRSPGSPPPASQSKEIADQLYLSSAPSTTTSCGSTPSSASPAAPNWPRPCARCRRRT